MLHLVQSNRLEALAAALAERLQTAPLADPLQVETIVVPHAGVGRWLQLWLADRFGVAAQLRFELPGQCLGRLLDSVVGSGSGLTRWQRGALQWRLFDLLAALPPASELAPLRRHLAQAERGDGLGRWGLAEHVADVFDAYQQFRPDWLAAWRRGERLPAGDDDGAWQAALWRELAAQIGAGDRSQLLRRGCQALADGAGLADPRLILFGHGVLAPDLLRFFAALAQQLPVWAFLTAPCREYFADLRGARERARHPLPDDTLLPPVAELLASLGRRAREAQDLLVEHWLDGSEAEECFEPPQAAGILPWLQTQLLELGAAAPPPLPRPGNLQIHACANRRREVEVLHDALLQRLAADPSLKPHEIAVMAPSLDEYAALLEAVFAADPNLRLRLSIADRSAADADPLLDRFVWLLGLGDSRFPVDEVLDFAATPAVLRRFGMDAGAADLLQRLAIELNVHWGLSAAQRVELGLGAGSDGSWRLALQRLLLGYVEGDTDEQDDGLVAHQVESSDAALAAGYLWRMLQAFEHWRGVLRAERAPRDWLRLLQRIYEAFFLIDLRCEAEVAAERTLREAFAELGDAVLAGAAQRDCGIVVVSAALRRILDAPQRWQNYLGDGITACALVPLRNVPFRVIAVLGLNDGEFPRRLPPPGFDLLRRQPRPGDRQPREDDRQLFLDVLLAARDHLHLSYVDRDPVEGSECAPSPVLAELLATLQRAYGPAWSSVSANLLRRQPLQPFAAERFAATAFPRSYAQVWWPASQARGQGALAPACFWSNASAATPQAHLPLSWHGLLSLLRNADSFFLRQRLGLSAAADHREASPLDVDALQTWQRTELCRRWLDLHQDGRSAAAIRQRLRGEGGLPPGLAGEAVLAQVERDGERLLDAGLGRARCCGGDAVLALGHQRLTAQVRMACLDGQLLQPNWRPESGVALLEIALQRELLIAAGQVTADTPLRLIAVQEDGKDHTLQALPDVADWRAALAAAWAQVQQRPLPFWPRTAWAFVGARCKGRSEAEALQESNKAWFGGAFLPVGESERADTRLLYRGIADPRGAEFRDWAWRLLAPLQRALA